jgi:hypothetical protein
MPFAPESTIPFPLLHRPKTSTDLLFGVLFVDGFFDHRQSITRVRQIPVVSGTGGQPMAQLHK